MPPSPKKRLPRTPRIVDAVMRRVITLGGLTVVATVVGMLVLILREAAPLFAQARTETILATPEATTRRNAPALFVAPNPRRDRVAVGWIDHAGGGGVVRFAPGDSRPPAAELHPQALAHPSGRPGVALVDARARRDGTVLLRWRDGALARVRMDARTEGVDSPGASGVDESSGLFSVVATDPGFGPARSGVLTGNEAAGAAVAWLESGDLRARRWTTRRQGLRRIREE